MIPIVMPILKPRLLLRPIEVSDAAQILDYKRESWAAFLQWMIWVHPPSIETRSIEDEKDFCARFHERFVHRETIPCLAFDRKNGAPIGHGSLGQCDWAARRFALGFAVRSGQTGRGYGTEIATALCAYAFGALCATKITALHADGNAGSQKIIEKIGFTRENTLPACHPLPDGRVVDEHHYALTEAAKLPQLQLSWGGRA